MLLCFEVFPEKVTLGDAEFSRNLKRRLGECSTGKSFRVVYGRIGFLENLKFQVVVKGIFLKCWRPKSYNLDVLAKFSIIYCDFGGYEMCEVLEIYSKMLGQYKKK